MTMMQKMQAKKSKKGFTLVELVIVIAILAILAAIAIPVITTTINSSKISTMESDCTTADMMIKEAVNTYMTNNSVTKYNGSTAATATVGDVLTQNNLASFAYSRKIGGQDYFMVWSNGTLKISGSGYSNSGTKIDASIAINTLETTTTTGGGTQNPPATNP